MLPPRSGITGRRGEKKQQSTIIIIWRLGGGGGGGDSDGTASVMAPRQQYSHNRR